MSIPRFLSALKGELRSPPGGEPIYTQTFWRARVPWGWCWLAWAPDRRHNRTSLRACALCTAAGAPRRQGDSYIPIKRRPADMNSDPGMSLDESTALALKKAVWHAVPIGFFAYCCLWLATMLLYHVVPYQVSSRYSVGIRRHLVQVIILILRGTIVNRTYGIHKNLPGIYLTIFY